MELHDSIIDRLNTQYLALPKIIKEVSEKMLDREPEPGKWSIRQNLAHITGYHHILLERLNKILKEDNPYFSRYDVEQDPEFKKWDSFSAKALLKHLRDNRETMNAFLFNLTAEELVKKGTHEKFGTMNVVQWIEFFLLHEAHHIYTIFKISRQFNT